MSINIERKTLTLNKCSINENIGKWIEQDIIVPDTKPDAVKIINVTVTPYVTDVETLDDKIKIVGKINYFVIYRVSDSLFNTRGLFVSYPYTETLNVKGINKNTNINVVPVTKNVIYSLPNERKIAVKSEIFFKVRATNSVCINLINKFDTERNIECQMSNSNFSNRICSKKNVVLGKEDIMLPKEAEDFFEILKVSTKIINTDYKESYNKIMVKGEIDLKILYLTENKEDQFKIYNTTIPFSTMIELDNIRDLSKFNIEYIIQEFNIRKNNDITSTKTLTADYQIEVLVDMYENENVDFVEDFYSQTQDLKYKNNRVDIVKQDINLTKQIDIKENLSNILQPNTKLLEYDLDINNIATSFNGNKINLEGNAKLNLMIQNMQTLELENKTVDVLINSEIPLDEIFQVEKIYLILDEKSLTVTQNDNDIEIKATLEAQAKIEDVTDINVIDSIEEGKIDITNLDSMNIYIVKSGDNLWNIAKKYKTSIDKIIKTNENLDKDKIDVGQKIFIIR